MSKKEAMAKAFEAARTAREIAPDDAQVHYLLARLYTQTNDRDEARAAYDKAIALNPSPTLYLVGSTDLLLYVGETKEAIDRLHIAMGIDPFHEDQALWKMGWALWQDEDCDGARESMLKMNNLSRGAHRMLAGIYACLGEVEKAQDAYRIFYDQADEPTISEQREQWKDIWTAPGALDRWLDDMRIAGMKE